MEKIIYQYSDSTARMPLSKLASIIKLDKNDIEFLKNETNFPKAMDVRNVSFDKKTREIKIKDGSGRAIDTIRFTQFDKISALVFEKDRHAINVIRRLGGFLNDVMLTNDPKQLSKVVESYAMPPGSYKRKRNSWWSFDLNAYVGGYAGNERIFGQKSSAGVYGITAPIGFSFSKTFGVKMAPIMRLEDDVI